MKVDLNLIEESILNFENNEIKSDIKYTMNLIEFYVKNESNKKVLRALQDAQAEDSDWLEEKIKEINGKIDF